MEIDKEMGNSLWMDAITLEMRNVRVAFEEFDGDPNTLVGYTQITGHLVFDVKLGENFRRKARYCADGHKTGAPASVTYSTVVSRDSVRILLTIAALNDLDILGADVQNAFLTAPNKEKCWMIAGSEFGPEEGKSDVLSRQSVIWSEVSKFQLSVIYGRETSFYGIPIFFGRSRCMAEGCHEDGWRDVLRVCPNVRR